MIKIVSIIVCLFLSLNLSGQKKKDKEVGINITQLATQFIPFKGRSTLTGPFAITWRSGSNGKFFNIQIGAQVSDAENNFANIQIGYLKKRELGEKVSYFTSQNFILSAGGLNVPNQESFNNGGAFGFSFGAGLQYEFTEHLALATETLLVIAFGDSGGVNFVPPIGLFLMAKF